MGRRTAAALRVLASGQGWLDTAALLPDDATIAGALAAPKRASTTISSLEPLRDQMATWHAQEGVSGRVILAALKREHGYTGSYSAVRRLLATLKRETPPKATVRLDFAPGEAAQVDFGAGPMLADAAGIVRRTWAFVMTLCFSRHPYVEFVFDQTVATWLGCHRRAFEWFCGVPARVIIDNAKCAIIKACQNDPEVQRSYADCAEGYGFKIDPCPPHDPQKKGIVESGVKYVKGNFLPLKAFRDRVDLNAQTKRWVMEEAGIRRHGTTGEAPLSRFEVERAVLRPLPAIAPDLGVWKQASVHRDCHLQFDRAFYSVPFSLVGQSLWLKANDGMVTVYDDFRPVAAHGRASRPGERRTVRDHLPPNAQAFFAHDRDWCLTRAGAIGPACAEGIERLLADRIVERLRGRPSWPAVTISRPRRPPFRTASPTRAVSPATPPVSWLPRSPSSEHRRFVLHGRSRYSAGFGHGGAYPPIPGVKVSLRRALPDLDPRPRAFQGRSADRFDFKALLINPLLELAPNLKQLRLSGILDSLEARNRQAIAGTLAYTEFLSLLIHDEVARRDQKKFDLRRRRAAFRAGKSLEGFDFSRLPNLNRALIHDLATGRYLAEKAPVLIVGPCGTGQSHLAQALGHCAVRQGVDVLFTTQAQLCASLTAARAVGTAERKIATLARVPLLIIDDFGLKPMRPPADEDFHDLIAERYEQAATLVTSHLHFIEWDQAFPANRLLAAATLDRLRHNAYCLTLDGASYRSPKMPPATVKSAPQKAVKSAEI